jgi:ABC-type transport system involved in multi-copper enzyme maturation permease subunit
MVKALVIKELRESAGIVVLAVLAMAYVLAELTATQLLPWQSSRLYNYPFVYDSLSFYFWIVVGGLAIALGFRQTAWELGQGTYFFLLHRPIRRRRIFALKLLVGAVLVMLIGVMLVGLYAGWASTPGEFDGPFFWSMTVPAWQLCLAAPPLYFGAFLSGIRPGRWYGSRLLPLVAGILATFAASQALWVWASAAISLVVSGFMITAILMWVEERDY